MQAILDMVTLFVEWFFELLASLLGNAEPMVVAIASSFILLLVMPAIIGAIRGFMSLGRRGK